MPVAGSSLAHAFNSMKQQLRLYGHDGLQAHVRHVALTSGKHLLSRPMLLRSTHIQSRHTVRHYTIRLESTQEGVRRGGEELLLSMAAHQNITTYICTNLKQPRHLGRRLKSAAAPPCAAVALRLRPPGPCTTGPDSVPPNPDPVPTPLPCSPCPSPRPSAAVDGGGLPR